MGKKQYCVITLLLFAISTFAQETVIKGVHCSVGFVQKNEGSEGIRPPSTSLRLVINGGIPAQKQGLIDIMINKAVDDTGKNLMPDTNAGTVCKLIVDYREKFDDMNFDEDFAELSGTDDNAKTIREVSGEILMHVPANDPQSRVIISSFQKRSTSLLKNESLEKAQLQIEVQTASEYLAATVSDPLYLKRAKEQTEKDMNQNPIKAPYQDHDLVFALSDPNEKLAGIELLDAKGNRLEMWFKSCRSNEGNKYYYILRPEKPAPKDAALAIYFETEKSIVKLPFTLKNLPLY